MGIARGKDAFEATGNRDEDISGQISPEDERGGSTADRPDRL
ncbi:MAG TPA: hypothetical protein VFX53_17875 [Pedococcus sp.]|nr:hypothetical protein [Pedococcus sp.]